MANIHSTITYNANLSPAQAQIKSLTGQIAGLTAAFNTLDASARKSQTSLATAFAADVGQIGGFTTQTVRAHNAVEGFGKQLAANKLSMREYFREAITGYTRQNSMLKQLAAQQVKYQQSVMVPTGPGQGMMITPNNLAATGTAAAMASQKFSIFNELVDGGANKLLNFGKNTQWAGRQLMVGFTVPLMMFTAVMSKQFRDLDKELTRFQKVYGSDLGNAFGESTTRMREQVEELAYSISRTYGIAAKETAALAADIAATGQEGQALLDSVQQTTRLAVLGEVDRQEAMKATLAIQSAFKQDTNELAESINFLNAVENQTSTTLQDLSTAIPKVGPVVRSLGGDIEDLATLLVAMREGGIPAAEAANALKSGLASLINPTKQASEVAKKFGVDLVGIVEANKGQLMPTIYGVQEALSGLDSFSRSKVIEQIFGKYQFARMTALFDNIGKTGSQTQQVLELAAKSSSDLAAIANTEIKALTESTSVKFMRTLEELKNSLMPLAETLTKTLIPIFETIGKGIRMFSDFFQALPEPIKNFVKYGVAITALAGPVIMLVGLFGNLIANGIRFGMMLTRIGARIAGLRFEKFELLNADVMAAKLGIDNLTKSFDTQEVAVSRLVGVMTNYENALRRMSTANPALFIPGATPGRGGQVPIRRQTGSQSPEKVPGGYGGGDRIPALLEPGEMVVRKEAASQYAPIIVAMNRGNIQKLSVGTGGSQGSVSLTGGQSRIIAPYTMFAPDPYGAGGFGMSKEFFQTSNDFELSLRASAITAKAIEDGLRLSRGTIDRLSIELEPITTEITDALRVTATEMTDAGQDATHISQVIERATPRIDAILSNLPESTQTSVRKILSPTMQQVESGGYYRVPSADIDPQTGQPIRTTIRSDRRGQAGSFYSRVKKVASKIGLDRTGMVQAHLPPENYSLLGPVMPLSGKGTTLSPQLRAAAQQYIERKSQEIIDAFEQGLVESLETRSPSKKMDRDMRRPGKDFGDGAVQGFVKGYKSSAAGKPIIAGPVGGGGIESISNAQKVAQADQTILKYKELQAKFISRRSIVEQQIASINAEIYKLEQQFKRGQINLVEFQQRKASLQADIVKFDTELKDASSKEKMYQDRINAAQQRRAIALEKIASQQSTPGYAWGPGGVPEDRKAIAAARRIQAGYEKPGDRQLASQFFAMPASSSSDKTGPTAKLRETRESIPGMRGQGAMNAMFMASMLASSFSMVSGASGDLAAKLGILTTAVMTASSAMMMFQGKNVAGNFLGLGSAGRGITQIAQRRSISSALPSQALIAGPKLPVGANAAGFTQMSSKVAAEAAKSAGKVSMMTNALNGLGSTLSMLGGPWGMAAAAGIAGVSAAFLLMKNAADEARQRSIAAFSDPIKSAEYFGETVVSGVKAIEDINLENVNEGLAGIDEGLREAVSQDYAPLIEKLKYSIAESGARELSLTFSSMLASGMSAENAKAAIEAIAVEAGAAGAEAFNFGIKENMFKEMESEEIVDSIVYAYDPDKNKNLRSSIQQAIDNQVALLSELENKINQSTSTGPGMGARGFGTLAQYVPDWMTGLPLIGENLLTAEENAYRESSRKLGQLKDQLLEIESISGDTFLSISQSLAPIYKDAPDQITKQFDVIKEQILLAKDATGEFAAGWSQEATDALMQYASSVSPIVAANAHLFKDPIDQITLMNMLMAGLGPDIEKAFVTGADGVIYFDKTVANSMINAQNNIYNLENAIKDLKEQFAEDIKLELSDDLERLDKRIVNITGRIENLQEKSEDAQEALQDEFDAAQKASDAVIEGYEDQIDVQQEKIDLNQEEIDAIQEKIDKEREATEERIESLEDEKELIEDSADAYIDSLKKKERADDYYSQQRKTSLSALEKLASGDVFGFLQERETLSQQAQQFSYDEMISGIEDRKDLEVEAIDETIEKERERQERWEESQQARIDKISQENEKIQEQIDLVQDQIDIERDRMEAVAEAYDYEMERLQETYETKINNAQNELEDKQRKRTEIQKLIDDAAEGEIVSAKRLAEVLPEEQAKMYVTKQKEILKNIFLYEIEQARASGQDMQTARMTATSAVDDLINSLISQTARSSAIQTPEEVISFLGAPPDAGSSGPPASVTSSTTTSSGTTPEDPNDPKTWRAGTNGQRRTTSDGTTYIYTTDGGWQEVGATAADGGAIKYRGGGGKISGPGTGTSDSIPALLSNGEYVIRASSVAKYGKQFMDSVNQGRLKGFKVGGDDYGGSGNNNTGGGQDTYEAKEHYGGGETAPQSAPQQQYNQYVEDNPEQHKRAVERGRKITDKLNRQVRILRLYTAEALTPQGQVPLPSMIAPISYSSMMVNPLKPFISQYGRTLRLGEQESNDLDGDKFNKMLINLSMGKYSAEQLKGILGSLGVTDEKVMQEFEKLLGAARTGKGDPSDITLDLQNKLSTSFRMMPKWMKELLVNNPDKYLGISPDVVKAQKSYQITREMQIASIRRQQKQASLAAAAMEQPSNNQIIRRIFGQSLNEAFTRQKANQIFQNIIGGDSGLDLMPTNLGGGTVPGLGSTPTDAIPVASQVILDFLRSWGASAAEMVGAAIDPQMVGNNPIADTIGGESYTGMSRDEKAFWAAISVLDFIPGAAISKPISGALKAARANEFGVKAFTGIGKFIERTSPKIPEYRGRHAREISLEDAREFGSIQAQRMGYITDPEKLRRLRLQQTAKQNPRFTSILNQATSRGKTDEELLTLANELGIVKGYQRPQYSVSELLNIPNISDDIEIPSFLNVPEVSVTRRSSANVSRLVFEKDMFDLERIFGKKASEISPLESAEILSKSRTEELLKKYPELEKGSPEFIKTFIKEYYPFAGENDVITLYKGLADEDKLNNLLNWTGNKEASGSYFSANPLVAETFALSLGGPKKIISIDVPIKDFINSNYLNGFPFYDPSAKVGGSGEMASVLDYLNVPDYVKDTLKVIDLDYYVEGKYGLERRGQPKGGSNTIFDLLDEFYPAEQYGSAYKGMDNGGLIKSFAEGGIVKGYQHGGEPETSFVAEGNPDKKSGRRSGRSKDSSSQTQNTGSGLSRVISLAKQYAHLPYYAHYPIATDANGNPTGWGCATSVAWLYKNGAGVSLPSPSMSYDQWSGLNQTVSESSMLPGDLIFQKNNGPYGVNKHLPVNHVEMYLGPGEIFNGGGGIESGPSYPPVANGIKRVIGGGEAAATGGDGTTTPTNGTSDTTGGEPQTQTVTTISFGPGEFGPGDRYLSSKLSLLGERKVTTTTVTTGGDGSTATGAETGTETGTGAPADTGSGTGAPDFNESLLSQEGVSVQAARNAWGYINSGGWPSDLWRLAFSIAMRESNGDPNAFSRYSSTNSDTGLFQVNEGVFSGQPWFDFQKLKDGVYNASVAYKYVSSNGTDFRPWALTKAYNGGDSGWDWSFYANSDYFAPGTRARSETIRRNNLFWNAYIPKYASGGKIDKPNTYGYISGPGTQTSDSIPALLSNGEYVVRASSVSKYGKTFMDDLNQGRIKGFKVGGDVDGGGNPNNSNGYYESKEYYANQSNSTSSSGYEPSSPAKSHRWLKEKQRKVNSWAEGWNSKMQGLIPPNMRTPEQQQIFAPLINYLKDIRVGLATALDAVLFNISAPWTRDNWSGDNDSPNSTMVGEFIGGQDYIESDAIDRLMSFLNIIPFGFVRTMGFVPRAKGGIIEPQKFATGGIVKPKRFGAGGIGRIFGNSRINQSSPNRGTWPEDVENPYPEDEPFVGMPDDMYEEWLTYDFQMPYYETSFGFKVPLFWMVDPTGLYTSTGPGPDDWEFDGEEWAKRYKNTIKEWENIKPSWKRLWDKKPGARAFANGGIVELIHKAASKIPGFNTTVTEPLYDYSNIFFPGSIASRFEGAEPGGHLMWDKKPGARAFAEGGLASNRTSRKKSGQSFARNIRRQVGWARENLIGTPYGLGHLYPSGELPAEAYKDSYRPSSIGCSPFVHLLYSRAGKNNIHSHYAREQEAQGGPGLSSGDFRIGDAVFFRGSDGEPTTHVGLLSRKLGRNSWNIIHSSDSGNGVREEGLYGYMNRIRQTEPDFAVSSVKRLNAGGFINGPGTSTSDSIPALLSDGEYVIRASSVAKYGKGFMDKVNSGQLGFANGGFVGSSVPSAPTFNMPEMGTVGAKGLANSINNTIRGSSSKSSKNSNNIKIVVNAAKGQNTKSIANQVVKLINNSNGRRVHGRSI